MNKDKEIKSLSKLVDLFAQAMKEKLIEKVEEDYYGWEDENDVPEWYLKEGLLEHVKKGPIGQEVDIANLAMFLWNRKNEQQGRSGR